MSDFIDDFHKAVNEWADHLNLEGDERDEYVSFHMEKGGYQKATTWTPPQPDENDKGGSSMFSKRRTAGPGAKPKPQPQGGPAGQYFRK